MARLVFPPQLSVFPRGCPPAFPGLPAAGSRSSTSRRANPALLSLACATDWALCSWGRSWLQGSESHRGPDLRAMNRLMAAGTPTGPTAEKRRVNAPADEDLPRRGLLLEMALEAKGLIARHQHALIHRTVRLVAGDAAFTQRLVL